MEIGYTAHLRRSLKKIKDRQLQDAFKEAIRAVSASPAAGSVKTGDLTGISTASFTYAGTQYRLAYRYWEERGTVLFLAAGTRENFYDELKRYLKDSGAM